MSKKKTALQQSIERKEKSVSTMKSDRVKMLDIKQKALTDMMIGCLEFEIEQDKKLLEVEREQLTGSWSDGVKYMTANKSLTFLQDESKTVWYNNKYGTDGE